MDRDSYVEDVIKVENSNLSETYSIEVDVTPDFFEYGDLIVQYLQRLGVEYVFGVPGGCIEPFYNALARGERKQGPKAVIARHETGAAFMAEGYARETGKLGVCCATTGPGTTNIITGVASAYAENIPLLVITAQTSLDKFGRGALQEASCTGINILGMLEHCTLYNSLVSHTSQLEHKLLQAIGFANGAQKGPVHLTIPVDLLKQNALVRRDEYYFSPYTGNYQSPGFEQIAKIIHSIDVSERVTFVIGEDCPALVDVILKLAIYRDWLVVTTPGAKGAVPTFHSAYRGVFGFAGHQSAYDALKQENADCIVLFGAEINEVTSSAWDEHALISQRLIHVSENAEHLSSSNFAKLRVHGALESLVEPLTKLLPDTEIDVLVDKVSRSYLPDNIEIDNSEKCMALKDLGLVKPQTLMTWLSQMSPSNTRALFDSGNSFLWGIHYWNCRDAYSGDARKNMFHIGIGFASMGWAIGASVGVAAGAKGEPVLCVTGDGSVLMSGQEITVALQENLNLLFVVLNDSALGMVKHGQKIGGAEPIGNTLPEINYAQIGEAMGIESYRIRCMDDLVRLDLNRIFATEAPCILDVLVDAKEVPPMGARMKVLTGVV